MYFYLIHWDFLGGEFLGKDDDYSKVVFYQQSSLMSFRPLPPLPTYQNQKSESLARPQPQEDLQVNIFFAVVGQMSYISNATGPRATMSTYSLEQLSQTHPCCLYREPGKDNVILGGRKFITLCIKRSYCYCHIINISSSNLPNKKLELAWFTEWYFQNIIFLLVAVGGWDGVECPSRR